MRVYKAFRHFFLLLVLITAAFSQVNAQAGTGNKTNNPPDAAADPADTSKVKGGDIAADTNKVKSLSNKSLLGSKVSYKASDSIRFDLIEQKVYMFGDGEVTYEAINLKADYIELDLKNNLVYAKYGLDSTGKEIGKPVFAEGDQSFIAREMAYNFETKKGRIIDVRTQEGDSYILSDTAVKDSNDVYYIRHGHYTTCNLDHPHYSIKAGKLKVIPNDKIVTGPAYLKVADIPTPLGIPFGFFPNKKGQASGIIMPQYGESRQLGFFLKEGGYYFGINDTFDLALKGDIYSYGSWAVNATTNYKIRYKFDGMFDAKYARIYYDDPEFTDAINDIKIRWIHTQDSKANPNSSFSANVDAGTSTFNRNIPTTSYQYLNNVLNSNVRYTRNFGWSMLSFNARHNQNILTRQLTVTAPEITWNVNRFYPTKILFKQKKGLVRSREIDKIGVSFITNASARIDTYDSALVKILRRTEGYPELDDVTRYGMKHTMPISTSMTFLKYLTFTPSISGTSYWYYKSLYKYTDATDTVRTVVTDGFRMANEVSFVGSLTTKLYGMANVKLFKMQAIRHVLTPNVSFTYRPDLSGSYYRSYTANTAGDLEYYSIFENGIYGSPGRGEAKILSWSLNNNVEMKLRDLTDSAGLVTRKVALIEGFQVSGGYNWGLEKFQMLPVLMTGRTKVFKVVDLVANAILDPYAVGADSLRMDVYEWKTNKRLARLTNASLTIGTRLQSRKKDDKPKESNKGSAQELEFINNNPDAFIDFNVPWTLGVNYTFQYSRPTVITNLTQSLGVQGDFSLTPKWKIGFTSNYDLEQGQFSYSSLNIYRDLHCWEMAFNWIPFGPRQSYTLDIRVKAPVLSDLKLSRRRDWYDFR